MSKKSLSFLRNADHNIDRRLSSGWLRMSQLPIGTTLVRRLIEEGFLDSIVVASPGSKRGVRLVSQESLDRYFRSLLPKGKGAPAK
jgi:hypothetical protein